MQTRLPDGKPIAGARDALTGRLDKRLHLRVNPMTAAGVVALDATAEARAVDFPTDRGRVIGYEPLTDCPHDLLRERGKAS
jgi:hypothetical protein